MESPLLSMLELSEEADKGGWDRREGDGVDAGARGGVPGPSRLVVDMPGIKGSEMNGQAESDNVLVVSGERRREKGKENEEGVK